LVERTAGCCRGLVLGLRNGRQLLQSHYAGCGDIHEAVRAGSEEETGSGVEDLAMVVPDGKSILELCEVCCWGAGRRRHWGKLRVGRPEWSGDGQREDECDFPQGQEGFWFSVSRFWCQLLVVGGREKQKFGQLSGKRLLHGGGHTALIIGQSDGPAVLLELVARVAHDNRKTGERKHFDVVVVIPNGHDL